MAVLEHFLFNSDYPADKIVYMKKGTMTIRYNQIFRPQFDFIETGVGTQLYAEGDYKFDGSDEVYPLDGHSGPFPASSLISFMKDGTCIIAPMFLTTNPAHDGKQVEYRIWAYYGEQEAKNIDISDTTNVAKPKLAFTSDNNYPRFIGDGNFTLGQTYDHNLGFIPLTKCWRKTANSEIPMPSGTYIADMYQPMSVAYFGNAGANDEPFRNSMYQVSKTSIKTYAGSGGSSDGIYFRMYIL